MFCLTLLFSHSNSYVRLPLGISHRDRLKLPSHPQGPLRLCHQNWTWDCGCLLGVSTTERGRGKQRKPVLSRSPVSPHNQWDTTIPSKTWGHWVCHCHKAQQVKWKIESEGRISPHSALLCIIPPLPQNPHSSNPTPGHRAPKLFLETRCSNMMPFVASNKEQGCQKTGIETLNGSLDITKWTPGPKEERKNLS